MQASRVSVSHSVEARADRPRLEVIVEVPRGSFIKRGTEGQFDFISPLPCPFNYGSALQYVGLEGDLLDAVVLGPRLHQGARVNVQAFGAVGLTDHGQYDDKILCSAEPISARQKTMVLLFFHLYAKCKGVLNLLRGRKGRNACEGWLEAEDAIARARPCHTEDRE